MYTCQLFLRYKREIFILGLLGFKQSNNEWYKNRMLKFPGGG